VRECGHAVSLLLEDIILGQARSAERLHLDPSRHMTPDLPLDEGSSRGISVMGTVPAIVTSPSSPSSARQASVQLALQSPHLGSTGDRSQT
jgi:hypothetical protein